MSNIMQDKYNLGQSENNQITHSTHEINFDLKLFLNTNNVSGLKIYGIVLDENKNPIKNATIKIMSEEYHPLFHTKTNSKGEYNFNNLPRDKSYNVFAISKGYMLEQSKISLFLGKQNLELDFVLREDIELKFSIISGLVVNSITNEPKENVVVKLINKNDKEILQAVTYTNNKGQFIFSKINKGNYLVNINALGFNNLNIEANIVNDGQLTSLTGRITEKTNISTGVISGHIKDCENNNFTEDADVILYEVKSDDSLNPIAFTKTIKDGFYMFGNVPKGRYKIKSNKMQEVKVNFPSDLSNSPNFYSFTISNSNGSFNKTYYAKDVLLYGSSKIENNFIENIGSFLGYLIIQGVNVPTNGDYNLKIKYVTTYNNRSCNISVNNISTETVYGFEATETVLLSSVKEKIISLKLVQGENVIKIYNE